MKKNIHNNYFHSNKVLWALLYIWNKCHQPTMYMLWIWQYFGFLFFFFLSLLPPVIDSGVEDFLVKLFFKIKAEAISIQGSHQLHHETPMMCMSLHFESFSIVMPVFTNKKRDSEWKWGGFGSIWGFLLSLFINPWVNCIHVKTSLSCCFLNEFFFFLPLFLLFRCSVSFSYSPHLCHKSKSVSVFGCNFEKL